MKDVLYYKLQFIGVLSLPQRGTTRASPRSTFCKQNALYGGPRKRWMRRAFYQWLHVFKGHCFDAKESLCNKTKSTRLP